MSVEKEILSSSKNPRIKRLLTLQEKSSERRKEGVFVIEGVKELEMAIEEGFEITECYVRKHHDDLASKYTCPTFIVEDDLFRKLVYRENVSELLAVAKQKTFELQDIELSDFSLVMVLESVEKPGNLGAVLRTCDGVKANALILCDPSTDIWNPNVIRSSVGTVFTIPTIVTDSNTLCSWLQANMFHSYAAALDPTAINLYASKFNKRSAIIFGTESQGLKEFWLKNSDSRLMIPMLGKNDSLNVSVSAAIIAYEYRRQFPNC